MMMSLVKDVLAQGDFGSMQALALVLFVGFMLTIAWWIFLPGSKAYYERIASDLLKGEEHGKR